MSNLQPEFSSASLGSLPLDDEMTLMQMGSRGIRFSMFSQYIAEGTPFLLTEWATFLDTPPEKLAGQYQPDRSFDTMRSDRILELTRLIHKGIGVFGTVEKFKSWLNFNSPALGGRQPKAMLTSTFGIRMAMDELGRIEHGVLA